MTEITCPWCGRVLDGKKELFLGYCSLPDCPRLLEEIDEESKFAYPEPEMEDE